MSDPNRDMLRILQANEERLKQTETKEVPIYTTGTFTPSFSGSGTAGVWTYSIQAGFYTRIGNRCLFNLTVSAATRPTPPTGDAWIIGLPFTSNATADSLSPVSLDTILNITLTGTIVQLTARVPINGSRVELIETTGTAPASASTLAATGLTATAFIRIAGHYMIA